MNKKYSFLKDPYNSTDQVFEVIGIAGFLIGIYFLISDSQGNSLLALLFGILTIAGIVFIIIGLIISFKAKRQVRLEISDNNLIIKESKQSSIEVPITDIVSIAQTYDVRKVRFMIGRGALLGPAFYKFFVSQTGYKLTTKNGQNYVIPQNLKNFPSFLADLQNINSSIIDDHTAEDANKNVAETEVQQKTSQEQQWHKENNKRFFRKY